MEDRKLIEQTLAGEADSFRSLVERHQNPVFRFALGLIGNREAAQDIAQEVFLAAFTHLSSFDASRASFSTWLFTIARNRCINWLKRKRPVENEQLDVLIATEPDVDPVANAELSAQLDQALAELPLEQKTAFLLAEIEDIPYAEIAIIENTTLGTVKSRIHRAKQRLQKILLPIHGIQE